MRHILMTLATVLFGSSFSMDLGKSGVYDSPMATDYYVKRFGFLFGGGRSGMEGIKALQGNGLVDTDPGHSDMEGEELMRNSVDTYYREVMPESVAAKTVEKYRTLVKDATVEMVELAPAMMGDAEPKMF